MALGPWALAGAALSLELLACAKSAWQYGYASRSGASKQRGCVYGGATGALAAGSGAWYGV